MKNKKQNLVDLTSLCKKLGSSRKLPNGAIVPRYPFRLFTTADLCRIGGFKLSAAPRLARSLHAAGFSTVPHGRNAVRDLFDPKTKKTSRGRVWFIGTGRIDKDGEVRVDLSNVQSVRHRYQCERSTWRFTLKMALERMKEERDLKREATQRDRRAPPNV